MRKTNHMAVLLPFVVVLLLLFLIDRPVKMDEQLQTGSQLSANERVQDANGLQITKGDGTQNTEQSMSGGNTDAAETANDAKRLATTDGTVNAAQAGNANDAANGTADTAKNGTDASGENSYNLPELTLVVGKTGSLYEAADKVYEPVYAEPDETSEEIAQLQYNCAVLPTDSQADPQWICVDLQGKGTGYVKKKQVDICTVSAQSVDKVRYDIVTHAYAYLGLKFKRYGKSLTDGIDCTNFFSQIYGLSGITVPDTPFGLRDLGIEQGTAVSDEEARPGDLVYYDKANDGDGHVGMYLGDGFSINSSGHSGRTYPEGGVRICRLLYTDRDSYQIYDILGDSDGK